MNWKQQADHLKDYGHTWGPGHEKEDYDYEPTEAELQAHEEASRRYKLTLEMAKVPAREKYVLAGEKFKELSCIPYDATRGYPPSFWREDISAMEIAAAREAAKDLGLFLEYSQDVSLDKNALSLSVECFGYLPNREGNVHRYVVSGIKSVETCLQLAADFVAIGLSPMTRYQNRHVRLSHTGELRLELEKWNLPFADAKKITKKSLTDQIQSALEKSSGPSFGGSVVSVAHFADDPNVKAAVLESDELRRRTMDACYKIPGYKDLPLSEKNKVYDRVKREIEGSMKKQKSVLQEPER